MAYKNQPIRLALVGAGVFAQNAHLPALLALQDRIEIIAVYSRTHASAAALAQRIGAEVEVYTDLAALLTRPDLDAVDLLLPIPIQAGFVEAALRAGKHVISEKPRLFRDSCG